MTYEQLIEIQLSKYHYKTHKKAWLEKMIGIFKSIEIPDISDKSILCILSNELYKLK